MSKYELVVIGASAGGVEALSKLVQDLPSDFPATICIVIHLLSTGTSMLPKILNKRGALLAKHPANGEEIEPGRIYVAPPNYHLQIHDSSLFLTQNAKENGFRPSIDVTMRTAAQAYGDRVLGVVLTGMLDDGTAGLIHIKKQGGMAIAQDPEDAMFPSMPQSAIAYADVDNVVPLADLAPLLVKLVHETVEVRHRFEPQKAVEIDEAAMQSANSENQGSEEPPSGFVCPECGGALWEQQTENFLKFRCRVGHAYSQDSLLDEQEQELEAALWSAVRMVEEQTVLLHRLANKARESKAVKSTKQYEDKIRHLQRNAELIRQLLHPNGQEEDN